MIWPSRTTCRTAAPRSPQARAVLGERGRDLELALAEQRRAADGDSVPSTVASTPRPAIARKSDAVGRGAPLSCAAWTIARASGCSLSASTAAARASSSSSATSTAARSVTTCSPRVSVPVLSKSTVSTRRIRSSASRSLTRIPLAGRDRRRDRDHERNRQAERVRAGDDQHGHRARDRLVDVAEQRPDDEGDQAGADRDVEERGGERDRPGPARGIAMPGPRRPAAGCRPASSRRRSLRPRPGSRSRSTTDAGHDPVADAALDRAGLAGDHRFVELGLRPRRSCRRPGHARPVGPARRRRAGARRRRPFRCRGR